MSNVAYYTNGKGYWLRREWKRQCPEKVFFFGRCQGVKGHRGIHWCYSASGNFEWAANGDVAKDDAAAGSTPPGHKDYVSPAKMQKHYFLSHYTDQEVKDKDIIAMLEKDRTPEKGASIDRPVVWKRKSKRVRR